MRELKEGKPDFTYFPYEAEVRRAKRYEFGAIKYKRDDWMPEVLKDPTQYHKSALRHLKQYLSGDRSEDHLAAVSLCMDFLMWEEAQHEKP